jgi:hypothetical protein
MSDFMISSLKWVEWVRSEASVLRFQPSFLAAVLL